MCQGVSPSCPRYARQQVEGGPSHRPRAAKPATGNTEENKHKPTPRLHKAGQTVSAHLLVTHLPAVAHRCQAKGITKYIYIFLIQINWF